MKKLRICCALQLLATCGYEAIFLVADPDQMDRGLASRKEIFRCVEMRMVELGGLGNENTGRGWGIRRTWLPFREAGLVALTSLQRSGMVCRLLLVEGSKYS